MITAKGRVRCHSAPIEMLAGMTAAGDSLPGRARRRRGRRPAVAAGVVVVALVVSGWSVHRYRNARVPLISAVVAVDANGERVMVPPDAPPVRLLPGTRVLASSGARGKALASAQREWVAAGTVPGAAGPLADLSRTALLDLRTLVLPNGAAVAAWHPSWRFVWPRDASVIAVAFSRTGHTADAVRVMRFLQSQLPRDGVFHARYRTDGSGVPDTRGVQSDGIAWALWATARIAEDVPAGERARYLGQLRPLIDGGTRAVLRLTDRPGALPAASQDYWEIRDERLSLGTAAPLAFGLEAAATLQTSLGHRALGGVATRRAETLRASITRWFGAAGYPRYLGDDEPDASVAFLLPPFTERADPGVVAAWRDAARRMARPAGGLAPGAGWRNDGVSWTPQTAIFALAAAGIGDRRTAERRLTWLAAHRTSYGALPEKVLSNGAPAGPAPLAWTDALVLLALDALE